MLSVFRRMSCGPPVSEPVRKEMRYDGPVECLVTGEAGSLPDRTSTEQYFSQYGDVDHVKETDEGLLVMFNNSRGILSKILQLSFSRSTSALHDTRDRVGGHRVAFHLLRPNVYGCDVTVTRHRVSVTVGDEVIRRITQYERYKLFDQALPNRQLTIRQAMVSFLPNQIEVQSLYSLDELPVSGWECELRVLQQITAFLEPFQDLLPQTSKNISCRDRCIHQECRKETSQSKALDTHDGEAIAVFKFTQEGKLQVAASEDTLKQLRQSYPTIDISCDTGMKTLTLRGPARAMYRARADMCSLVKNLITQYIELDPWKMKVLNNPDARKRIQRALAKNNILCFWVIGGLYRSHFLVKVIALQKDQPRVKQVFKSSFQTINIPIDENQKSSLQSDAWKLCLERLRTSREGEPAPVVGVGVRVNEVVIRGLTVSVESARRAVLDFFHRNDVVQTYPQLYGQEAEEVITGLKPWQMKLLTNTNLKERIVAELPDLALLDVQSDSLVIKAPLRVLTESVSLFWRFVASLSQREIHLTTALAEMYRQPAARSKVQTLLKAAGLPCQCKLEDDHITVSAEDADQEPLKQIFTSTFLEASVHVAPEKSHLLRSEDFQALVTELRGRKSGFPTPVIQTSPGNNCLVIVDDSESCSTVQRAIEKFFENHDVLTTTSQVTQTQSPQHENFAAQTEVEEIQTEERHQQTGVQNLRSTEQQTDNRQLENKAQQTRYSREKTQRTERSILTENGFQTDKITTKEQQLQTDQSQLESTGQQIDDSKKATHDKRLQTERGHVQGDEIQTVEKHKQTEERHLQSTAKLTENRPLKNAELQTDDSRVLTVETQTEGATFTERGFQTENLKTDEKQLQTDQRETNSKQQQTESKTTENKESQSGSNATTTTENQTQTEGQRTEGQTEESNTRTHAQGEECELTENPGTATLVPESLDNAGHSSQTERKRTNETALSVNQFQVQMVQTRNVQSQVHQCPVEVPSSNPSSVHADLDTYTCVDEIQAEESTSDDESQTFPKRIIESEVEMGLGTRTQTSVPHCREALPQHMSCLTVEQLLELCTHLGVSQETLQHLQSSCSYPEDLTRSLVDRCIAASDSTGLLLAVLRLFARNGETNTSSDPEVSGVPAQLVSAVPTAPHASVGNRDEPPTQSQSQEVVVSGGRLSAETAQAVCPPLSSTEGNTFSETQPFSSTLQTFNTCCSSDSFSALTEAPALKTVVTSEQSSPFSQHVCLPSVERGEQEYRHQTCREPALHFNGSQQPSLEACSMTSQTHLTAVYSGELSEAHIHSTLQTEETESAVTSYGGQSLSRAHQHIERRDMSTEIRMAQMQECRPSPIQQNLMPSSPFQANLDLCLEFHSDVRPATDTNAREQVLAETVCNLRRDLDNLRRENAVFNHGELTVDNLSSTSSEVSQEAFE